MDEPENHLHAESIVSTGSRIIAANTSGQIWIATHSVPLIAALYKRHFADLSVYFMHEGEVSFASERPEMVLNSLMGGEENIEALREFIDMPEVFATNRFAAQCLQTPDVVADDQTNDPQVQIANAEIEVESGSTKLLDVGCGKGRLLASLFALHGNELASRVDYVGWDATSDHQTICEQIIEKSYGSTAGRWFCDRQLLMQHHPAGSFSCVVLCNVLHEINPQHWVETFNDTSLINQSLSDIGKLLIIEDYLMPKGEYAHPFGFVVLDTEALQKLFCVDAGNDAIKVHSEREGRIKGHIFPKPLLANVSHESVRNALQFAQQNAKERINALRGAAKQDFKAGRAHGFWVQQFANTSLALT